MTIKKIIDLSWPITNKTPIFQGDPVPKIEVATTIDGIGYNLFSLFLGSQTGTHIDAPYHLLDSGKTLDQIPLDYYFGEALIVDMTHKGSSEKIEYIDCQDALKKLGNRKVVLFRTDWYKYAGTDEFFKHPYLTKELAGVLIDLGVKLVCIDALNADMTYGATEYPAHVLFAKEDVMVAENMINFDLIDFEPYIVMLPLNIVGGDGSPIRAVALRIE